MLHTQVLASQEYQMRMKGGRDGSHLPVFEAPRKAYAVVDVARRSGQMPKFSSVPASPSDEPTLFQLGEFAGATAKPILCFTSVKAACHAKFLSITAYPPLPHGVDRMVCTFEVGVPGEGEDSVVSSSSGSIICSCVKPVALKPLPSGADGAAAVPRPSYWVPGGGMHALD